MGIWALGLTPNITLYTPHENKEIMFEMPRLVIKSGEVIVDPGRSPPVAHRQDPARRAGVRCGGCTRHPGVVRKVLLHPLAKLPC